MTQIDLKPVIMKNLSIKRRLTNNWRKLHHKPMRRKPLKKQSSSQLIVFGIQGAGKPFFSKLHELRNGKVRE